MSKPTKPAVGVVVNPNVNMLSFVLYTMLINPVPAVVVAVNVSAVDVIAVNVSAVNVIAVNVFRIRCL
jgi:hypothetical protein